VLFGINNTRIGDLTFSVELSSVRNPPIWSYCIAVTPSVKKFLSTLNLTWEHHAKIFGWAKSAAYDRRSTSDLWPITHNTGIWGQTEILCDVKFSKEW